MRTLKQLFDNNRDWAEKMKGDDPQFFERLSVQQTPKYLWIGCSDSRVPANKIVSLSAGDIFEHRNVANLVVHTDFNCLSVIQYAVEILKVHHIIVCGHYGCGGVKTAMGEGQLGLIDNWLRHIKDVIAKHDNILATVDDPDERADKLCELNVIEQVHNVCNTTIVQNAWSRGEVMSVHGWIYSLKDGLIRDLNVCINSQSELAEIDHRSLVMR